jgi:hypothetical protein
VVWAYSTHRRHKKCRKILVGKPSEKRPLERPRRRWEDNIRMDLGETGWKLVECMHLVLANTILLASQGGLCSIELAVFLFFQ